MKLNNMLTLGFERNESCLPIILRNYQFTYAALDLLKALINGFEGIAVRGALSPFSGLTSEIVNSIVREKSGNFRNLWLWQPCNV